VTAAHSVGRDVRVGQRRELDIALELRDAHSRRLASHVETLQPFGVVVVPRVFAAQQSIPPHAT
jgi:hypothetical protein